MKKFLMLTITGVMALGSVAIAQPRFDGPGERREARIERRGPGGERLFEFLGLSEAQQSKWRAAHEAHRDATQPLREAARANREALRDAVDAEDALRIGELTIEGKSLRDEMRASFESLQGDLAAILDPEQLEKWEAFQAARAEGPRFERRGRRGAHDRRLPRRPAGQV
jgi:Spy/CpxP family protein refolding chaperone